MKLNLNYASAAKRELIHEVVETWYKYRQKDDKEPFFAEMKELGWSVELPHGMGSFKSIVHKGSIVAKFAQYDSMSCDAEVDREWEQFQTAPAKLKRHLPRCHYYGMGLLVQDKVIKRCRNSYDCSSSEELANELDLCDYGHNHGHNRLGTVKFFDWVWRRRGPWLEDLRKPLKEDIKPGE